MSAGGLDLCLKYTSGQLPAGRDGFCIYCSAWQRGIARRENLTTPSKFCGWRCVRKKALL